MIWKYGRPVYTTSGATAEIVWIFGRPTINHDYIASVGVTIPIIMQHRQQQGQS